MHGHAFTNSIAIFAHIVYTLLYWPFWNHLTCESSHLSSRGTLSCFAFLFQCSQSVLRNLSSFFHEQRFCLPLLCFNSEKQAPTHLSVFPYLLPHCVLEDLSTTRVTWVGGLLSQDFNTDEPPPPIIPLLQKALTATIHLSQAETMHIFHCPISNPNPTI